ncbi:MAG: carbonic anhydrase [Candidatus Obscuribacterales bacterium]|nr:carbonic anhydrase [Candidatus Obscuribacterales bacterium]
MTTDIAIDELLIEEMRALPFVTYLDDVQLSDGLLSGDIQGAMLFACSDMGLQLPYVCSSAMARLFIFQTFGHNFSDGVRTVMCQGISEVIVYGHSNCEFLKFLAKSKHTAEEEVLISKYFRAEHKAQRKYFANHCASDDNAQWLNSCRGNVLNEIKSMLSYPEIADLASKGRLRFHAWLLRSDNNTLEIFDPALEAFVSAHADTIVRHSMQLNQKERSPRID